MKPETYNLKPETLNQPNQLYYLSLIPPEPLREEVRMLKLEMKDRFGAKHALKSPAHLTLQMPFRRPELVQEGLIVSLKETASGLKPFSLKLSGFDFFEPRVVFIKVVEHLQVQSVHASLRQPLVNSLQLTEKELTQKVHPHMTIATRDLTEDNFYRAKPEFEQREFDAEFTVQSLFLMKHNGKFWDIYREFEFAQT